MPSARDPLKAKVDHKRYRNPDARQQRGRPGRLLRGVCRGFQQRFLLIDRARPASNWPTSTLYFAAVNGACRDVVRGQPNLALQTTRLGLGQARPEIRKGAQRRGVGMGRPKIPTSHGVAKPISPVRMGTSEASLAFPSLRIFAGSLTHGGSICVLGRDA